MYKIVRMFSRVNRYGCRRRSRVIKRGLTRAEAVEYCSDPETLSKTAVSEYKVRYTKVNSEWFDGFDKE